MPTYSNPTENDIVVPNVGVIPAKGTLETDVEITSSLVEVTNQKPKKEPAVEPNNTNLDQ